MSRAGQRAGAAPTNGRGFDVVRVALAAILLTAAGLKAHQLATEPLAGRGIFSYRGSLMAQVEFEIVLAAWLLSGLRKRLAWAAAERSRSARQAAARQPEPGPLGASGTPAGGGAGPSLARPWTEGLLPADKEWFVTTPAVVVLRAGQVLAGWEAEAPRREGLTSALRCEEQEATTLAGKMKDTRWPNSGNE
jgi:uncharacterized SAM-binding protein YcdF (DUF218 family)